MSDLRTRIAVAACGATSAGKLFPWDTLSEPQKDAWRAMADAVIAELGDIPNREFIDDQGRTWEWCDGEPGTWAWRVTRLGDRR